MAEREQIPRPVSKPKKTEQGNEQESSPTETGKELKAELDGLLDEIDEVLETNAEDFVKSYVQKGGQ